MTPREPDRFDKQAQDLCLTEWRRIAAALRAAESEALERAAQDLRGIANSWRIYEHATAEQGFEVAIRELFTRARALKPDPAAAPAKETMSDEEARRLSTFDAQLAKAGCDPAAAPAAESDHLADMRELAIMRGRDPTSATPPDSGDREALPASSWEMYWRDHVAIPLLLAQRILAALERAWNWEGERDSREFLALADELRKEMGRNG